MPSSGPGCPATAFEGAKRRANAFVARRVVSKLCLLTTEDRWLRTNLAYSRTFSVRERYIVPVSSNFPVPIGHNANFAWNQDEVPQNSREAKKFFNIS